MTNTLPRYITARNVRIGDTIRVKWAENDTIRSITGIVATRQHHTCGKYIAWTEWETTDGETLFQRDSAENTYAAKTNQQAIITLLKNSNQNSQPTLEGIEL
jgi:hypothetical protein